MMTNYYYYYYYYYYFGEDIIVMQILSKLNLMNLTSSFPLFSCFNCLLTDYNSHTKYLGMFVVCNSTKFQMSSFISL
jgi:hypothetical protein